MDCLKQMLVRFNCISPPQNWLPLSGIPIFELDHLSILSINSNLLCKGLSKRFHKYMAYTMAKRLSSTPAQPSDAKDDLTAVGKLRPTMSSSYLVNNEEPVVETQFARRWLGIWNRDDSRQLGYFTDNLTYRDPFCPAGYTSRADFQKHRQTLRSKYKRWVWEEPYEIYAFGRGFTFRAKVTFETHTGQILTDLSLSIALLNESRDKISQLEIFFDTSQLKVPVCSCWLLEMKRIDSNPLNCVF